jgi:UDP-N-acetylglucosamine 2-epimerase (non-hydrolysing)
LGINVGHVEAGLRSGDTCEPFPEEFHRRAISLMTAYDFAPTESAAENLISEGKSADRIFITGNTVADAIKMTIEKNNGTEVFGFGDGKRVIVLTVHRRENMGRPMRSVFRAIKRIAEEYPDVSIVYPVHPNPVIKELAACELDGVPNVHLISPLGVVEFHGLLSKSYMIATDSGGIQEEATFIGKPVVVLRERTERNEGVKSGNLLISGVCEVEVYKNIKRLLDDEEQYEKMNVSSTVYGDGSASEKIADAVINILNT